MIFNDVMVDVESTGTDFGKNAIIQIAAVKFDYETGQVSDDMFDRCLHIHPGREWDQDCRIWWYKQNDVLEGIQARAEDPYTVVRSFYDWLLKDWPQTTEGLRFWSKPSHFDHCFISNYMKMFGLEMPCSFRYARDLNTFMAGLKGDPGHPSYADVDFQGDAHNALYDVIHQIKLLLNAKSKTVRAEILP